MYDYSGVWFKIWGLSGTIFLLGVLCLIFKKNKKYGCIGIFLAISLALLNFASIAKPSVSEYNGEFIEEHRNGRSVFSYEYTFWNGDGNKEVMYLDVFSKKRIYPSDFIRGHIYKVYYDKSTRIILKVDD